MFAILVPVLAGETPTRNCDLESLTRRGGSVLLSLTECDEQHFWRRPEGFTGARSM